MQKYSVNQQLIETVLTQEFLAMRRALIVGKIKEYYFTL